MNPIISLRIICLLLAARIARKRGLMAFDVGKLEKATEHMREAREMVAKAFWLERRC